MPPTLSETDHRLLNLIQEHIPLVAEPFAQLGQELNLTQDQVLQRMTELKRQPDPVIRQISAIFDTKALGYDSSLIAAKVDPNHLDQAAVIINQHPGVSHNYQRSHAYNLWYTLAVPPHSRFGLQGTIDLLHQLSGAIQTRPMPTLKLFKIGVKLNLSATPDLTRQSGPPKFQEQHRQQVMTLPITEIDQRMIRILQQDLPLIPRPFDSWAQQAQVTVPQLLTAAERYAQEKRMRRFSAVLHHRQAGFSANGMGVWIVPPDQQEHFGQTAAGFDAVSHCYLRPTYEDWPYNMFTMVHAPTEPDCNRVLQAISQATGITQFTALFSTREYKKTRVQYFMGDIEAWEKRQAEQ